MFRPVMAYVLTAVVLLVQTGLPLHFHYCKGALESISVFITSGCDDHEEVVALKDCCKKLPENTCTREGGDCCDDQTRYFLQDFNSPLPHFYKWEAAVAELNMVLLQQDNATDQVKTRISFSEDPKENGPPLYILLNSLIYYG